MAMIAKNEAPRIKRCFDSFWDHVDQVVLVDTGSTDKTIGKARAYAQRKKAPEKLVVARFSWCDDFSAARQRSWDLLTTDWGCWTDLDDTIEHAERLRALAAFAPPEVAGWIFGYDYATDEQGNVICYLERERLVRRGIGESWQLPIHEVLLVPGQLVRSGDAKWIHSHPLTKQRDPERNYKILQADLDKAEAEGRDPNPRTIAYLGTELLSLGRSEEAEPQFRRYLEVGSWDEELCQVAHKLSICLRVKGDDRLKEAEEAAFTSIRHRPDWADGYLDLAEISFRRGEDANAIRWADLALERGAPQTLLIVNPLEYDYQPSLLKSAALARMGQMEEALKLTEAALAITPQRDDLRAQAAACAHELKIQEATSHLLTLRELLVRHDENLAAYKLMTEAVPYFIKDRPEVAQAILDQREMCLHAVDPEVYASYYRTNENEAPFELQGVELEKAHEAFHRVKFLRDGLKEQVAA